jgi:hypothetical protein
MIFHQGANFRRRSIHHEAHEEHEVRKEALKSYLIFVIFVPFLVRHPNFAPSPPLREMLLIATIMH